MSEYYKIAIDIINRNERNFDHSTYNDMCCLCYKKGDEGSLNVDDIVTFKLNSGIQEEELLKILVFVLGNEVIQTVTLLDYVCSECGKAAIQSYIFKKNCLEQIEKVTTAINNLSNNIITATPEDVEPYQSLYFYLKSSSDTIEQYYDSRKLPKSAIAQTFNFMFGHWRDVSTIFIKTPELMLDPNSKVYTCKMCSKTFPVAGTLRAHFFSTHFKKEFECPKCPKSFGTLGLLNSHVNQCHNTVKCSDCGKTLLNRRSSLKRHQLTHNRQHLVCERCGRSYKKEKGFQKHLAQDSCTLPSKVHSMYVCDYCDRPFKFKHQIVYHIRFDHLNQKGYVCTWCQKKYYNPSALKVHMLKHTGEKNFECKVCHGRFVTRQSLMNHERLHTGERPYACQYCPMRFLSASRRSEHVERIHMDMSFDCDMCDAKYNARRSLVKHRKIHSTKIEN